MKEIQGVVTITVRAGSEILKETTVAVSIPVDVLYNKSSAAEDHTIFLDGEKELTADEKERYAVVSDLANVCDWLEESEVIKMRLIASKAQARRERSEKG